MKTADRNALIAFPIVVLIGIGVAWAGSQGGAEDPYLRRWAGKFHEPARYARQFFVGQPALLRLGAETLYPARFHRPR